MNEKQTSTKQQTNKKQQTNTKDVEKIYEIPNDYVELIRSIDSIASYKDHTLIYRVKNYYEHFR